jgi:hypothetical protein
MEMAFFRVRVGLNSLRLLEGFDGGLQVVSFEGEGSWLLTVFLPCFSRRMSRRCPSDSKASNLDEADDAKDKLEDDEAAE